MQQLLLVVVLALLLLPRQAVAADPAQNTLMAAEKAAGWQLLFDGRTLDAWRGYQDQCSHRNLKIRETKETR